MPQRSSRNARNTKSSQQPLSPPMQQPTPLPDELLAANPTALIDFDTPTPPQQPFVTLPDTSLDVDHDIEPLSTSDMESTYRYRSPPFREALLPLVEESPPPLPVLPRMVSPDSAYLQEDAEELDEVDYAGQPVVSHSSSNRGDTSYQTRQPDFSRSSSRSNTTSPRSPSTFDNITRTIRGYVHTPIPIATPPAGPSPPLVSKPVSFGRFSGQQAPGYGHGQTQAQPQGRRATQQEFERDYERDDGYDYDYGSGGGAGGYGYGSPPRAGAVMTHTHHPQPSRPSAVDVYALASDGQHVQREMTRMTSSPISGPASGTGSGLARAMRRGGSVGQPLSPRSAVVDLTMTERTKEKERDVVVWARWDRLDERRLLLLAYASGGLQIWDCTDLGAISEMVNLDFRTDEWKLVLLPGGGGNSTHPTAGSTPKLSVRVLHAAVLPPPSRRAMGQDARDPFGDDRPLMGILLESVEEYERDDDDYDHEQRQEQERPETTLILYSLRRHQVVKRLSLPGRPETFVANEHFIVLSATTPTALHIHSSATFQELYTIPSASLELFTTPTSFSPSASALNLASTAPSTAFSTISNAISSTSVSLSGANSGSSPGSLSAVPSKSRLPPRPQPVFALSHRLLAYASPSSASSAAAAGSPKSIKDARRLSSSSSASGPSSSVSSSPFGGLAGVGGALGLGKITQADVGHAAMKVGESVLGGMRLLGGMAFEAARTRVGAGTPVGGVGGSGSGSSSRHERRLSGGPGLGHGLSGSPGSVGARFVSRSAPDNTSGGSVDEETAARLREREREREREKAAATTVAPSTRNALEGGYLVTVVDLAPLFLASGSSNIAKVDEFVASRSQPVARIEFAEDGTSLGVVLRDGHLLKVFKLRPTPGILSRGSALDPADGGDFDARRGTTTTQMYELRRGRTGAVVECVDWAEDGRWLGIATRNRTVHVFAVNPYGGKTDVGSHLDGRVKNVEIVEPRTTLLAPVARLRGARHTSTPEHHVKAGLAFTFISGTDLAGSSSATSPSLLPPLSPPPPTHSPTLSPTKAKRGTNYQHVLVFDPEDGVLSLRRLTLEKHAAREMSGISGGVAASVQALGVTSISLPGMGGAGRLSSSPSSKASSVAKTVDAPMELGAKESIVATWHLRRGRDSADKKKPIVTGGLLMMKQRSIGGDWLSEAELSTCSNSQRVLPRSLYLSHQFSFHTLGEDYHALIRSYRFDISGAKIDVRKEVEISAYSSEGNNSAFIEGFTAPRDIRRASSSFDEPIASAISGSFDNSNIPAILPMYPNGLPGSKPKTFRSSIPIRTMTGIGDGVTEGLGRIRREMHKVRSPQLVPRSDSSMSGTVPLEFDEEDEDFLVRDTLEIPSNPHGRRDDSSTSRGTSREGASAESMSTSSMHEIATPANTSTHHLLDADIVGTVDEEMFDGGWDRQDKQAIEEAEQFDDIAAAGYLAEEQERQQQLLQQQQAIVVSSVQSSKRKGRKRGN